MAISAVLEPLVIVALLAGGTLINRDTCPSRTRSSSSTSYPSCRRPYPRQDVESALGGGPLLEKDAGDEVVDWDKSEKISTLTTRHDAHDGNLNASGPSAWRRRTLRFWGWERTVTTPNTELHKDRLLSRLLRRYPFLVEVWYWALIYWVRITYTHAVRLLLNMSFCD